MAQIPQIYNVGGGLDQASPALAVSAGRARAAMNYEPLAEGYGSIEGFERIDGHLRASRSAYWTLGFITGVSPIVAGQTLTGATSGATAVVLLDPVTASGTWGAGNAAGTLVLGNLSGVFQTGETLLVAGTPKATALGIAIKSGAETAANDEIWNEAAQEWARSIIQKPPGSGPSRCAFVFNDSVYCIRDNAGGTNAAIWRASPTGWEATPQSWTLRFSAGLVEIDEGQVLIGATSGATGLVRRVVRKSGNWGSSAAGYVVLTGIFGTFQANEVLRVSATPVATCGALTENLLPAGGRYTLQVNNFYGASNLSRVYLANGVGNAFEFDAAFLTFIETGTPVDRPTHIAIHRDSLALGFPGGSLQISVPGEPLLFDGELGAIEYGLGTDITDLQSATETALAVFGASKIGILTGNDVDTWQFDVLTDQAGARPWTAQSIGQVIYLDNRGLRSLSGASTLGNFKIGALSELIEPLLRAKRDAGSVPVASWICKTKGHYRLLWNDGTGISVYMGRKVPEIMPFETGDVRFNFAFQGEFSSGEEVMLATAADGFVYRLDKGTSMDGVPIKGFVMFPFTHVGAPYVNKRWHGVEVELDAAPQTRLGITAQFDYADGEQPADGAPNFFVSGAANRDFVVTGGGGIWDASVWDNFFWDAAFEGQAWSDIDGLGVNMSVIVATVRAKTEPRHVLKSYTVFYSARGQRRRYG